MRALVTRPGEPGTIQLIDVPAPRPRVGDVVIAMREVGIDGTDRDVVKGEHGDKAPPGDDYLVLGHESLGQVQRPAGRGRGAAREGDWVVCTVRRPDGCPNCRRGQTDMCLWGRYTERGIKGAH